MFIIRKKNCSRKAIMSPLCNSGMSLSCSNEQRESGHGMGDDERAQGKTNVASLVERKTRFAVLFRNNDRSTTHLMNKLMSVMEPLPQPARKSITFDRGIEFRNWRKLKPGIGTEAWFCDPQAPWQKGSVENLNKRARRYLPRDAPVAALSNRDMKAICDRLNGTPRKCLGWRTPTEAFREELMKLR